MVRLPKLARRLNRSVFPAIGCLVLAASLPLGCKPPTPGGETVPETAPNGETTLEMVPDATLSTPESPIMSPNETPAADPPSTGADSAAAVPVVDPFDWRGVASYVPPMEHPSAYPMAPVEPPSAVPDPAHGAGAAAESESNPLRAVQPSVGTGIPPMLVSPGDPVGSHFAAPVTHQPLAVAPAELSPSNVSEAEAAGPLGLGHTVPGAGNWTTFPSEQLSTPGAIANDPAMPSIGAASSTAAAPLAAQYAAVPNTQSPITEPPSTEAFEPGPPPVGTGSQPSAAVMPPAQPAAPQETLVPVTGSGKSGAGRPPFDPIKENGPIFVDWPDPSLALVISGNQNGYLEPCGCAGLDRMKGGLSRRLTLTNEMRQRGWPTFGLDVGGLCKTFGRQAELKFHTTLLALEKMSYRAITLGTDDLKFPANELLAVTADMPDNPTPFLSANVAVFGFDVGLTKTHRVIEEAGWRIGVTGVLGAEGRRQLANPEIETDDAKQRLAPIVAKLLEEQCDCLILLAHATMEETKALAEAYPDFNVVVTAGGGYEPPAQPEVLNNGRTILVEVGEKGMACVVLGLYKEPRRAIRYQRVPLDSRFVQSPVVNLLMQDYQDRLREDGFEKLGIRAVAHPKQEIGGNFVGSKRCETCHEPSYDVWRKSKHAKAWATLQNAVPPRTFDPECISCHVVGWHPTNYFPYQSGYWSEETTPHLVNVGCESCHGPGENHCRAEEGGDLARREEMRKAVRVTLDESRREQCASCHDLDNSPDFDFDTYWPQIFHKESLDP